MAYVNKINELFEELGHREFIIQLLEFELDTSRAIASDLYDEFMENDYYTSLFQIYDLIENY